MAMWSRLMTVEALVVGVIGTLLYTYWFIRQKGLLKNLEQITEIKHALIELRRVGWSERAIKKSHQKGFSETTVASKTRRHPSICSKFHKRSYYFCLN